ncbi:hypothetical protein FRC11_001975 [Ceratobasidium sp. 423]|nr:hypothetical protein FRC11_001975 [Ceratobasidium sp. 423]
MLLPTAPSALFTASSFLFLASLVLAAPLPEGALDKTVVPLGAGAIAAYSYYTNFVAAAYCSVTKEWECTACKLIPDFELYALGGDGSVVPYWYVGWWPTGSTVIVAHQGTDPLQIRSLITDAHFFPTALSTTLFPNASNEIKVHSGFKQAQAASALPILAAVKQVMGEKKVTTVTVVGHSLGGAIAVLDTLFLKLNLPPTVAVKGVTYGQPRVGNPAFANWFDQTIRDFSRVTNKKDVIPILPGRFLGFRHTNGEKHIKSQGKWYACDGQDNKSPDCSVGEVSNIFKGKLIDHMGPYEDVWFMEKVRDETASKSTPNLETANPATTLFMIGTPTKVSSSKHIRSSVPRVGQSRLSLSSRPKPTETSKPNNRPIIYGTARPKPKPDNKPVAQSVPLAFPASTNFVFNAPNLDTQSDTTDRNSTIRTIQILPTDVLLLVIRSIEPNRHHQILKNLSLVSRVLNAAIAPILYHRLRLFNLKEIYEFAFHFRHPTSVTSLEMFPTPDPQDLEWSPNIDWTAQLVETLKKSERLMSLTIKRCSNSTVLDSIIRQSNDPGFLPALQRLSFGYWPQLTRLASGRSLTGYGLAFDIQGQSDYESLDRALIVLKLSSKSILELKLTVTFTDRFHAHVDYSSDYRAKIMQSIVQHFPQLHSLTLRIQSRKSSILKQHKVVDILTLIPQKMAHLNYLELFDVRSPQFHTDATLKVAKQLSAVDGLCPDLEFLSLDGLLWKRAPDRPTSQEISLNLSHLTLNERGGNIHPRAPPNKTKSDISLPEVTWTPCPGNPRGLTWWAKKAHGLVPSSRIQTISLLREWMLKYWDPAYVPTDDSALDRAVPHW